MVEITETAETIEISKNGEKSEVGKYLGNFAWVLCIWYTITFQKKSVPVSAFFDSSNEVNAIYKSVSVSEFLDSGNEINAIYPTFPETRAPYQANGY